MELLTAAQMRALEQAAMRSGEVTGLELMERAGRGVVDAIFDEAPGLAAAPAHAIVLCGPGNNGGDGFVVARLLKDKGWAVDVYLYGDAAGSPPDAATNAARWRAMGEIAPWSAIGAGVRSLAGDLIIDAVFGIGLSRALPIEVSDAFAAISRQVGHRERVAVDVPSGLCADSGRILTTEDGAAGVFDATLCVTFHSEKPAHRLGSGPARLMRSRVVDIGLQKYVAGLNGPRTSPEERRAAMIERRKRARLYGPQDEEWTESDDDLLDLKKRPWDSVRDPNKYSHGHALVLSGGVGKGGAARLAARGALRIGAGLVTLGAPPAAIIENAARLDAIMLARIGDAAALTEALADKRINALVLGPGMGVNARVRDMVAVALSEGRRGVVLDADALTVFADAPEDLFALTAGGEVVLTPHMGEFSRLFPDIAAALTAPALRGPCVSKIDAARAAAARAGCVVLLKGPDTVVADAQGRAAVVSAQGERACPWLATAGAGDVLAGMIAGLLARGHDPKRAAQTAAWLHQEAARAFGPGLIAEDLPEMLPKVFRNLGVA